MHPHEDEKCAIAYLELLLLLKADRNVILDIGERVLDDKSIEHLKNQSLFAAAECLCSPAVLMSCGDEAAELAVKILDFVDKRAKTAEKLLDPTTQQWTLRILHVLATNTYAVRQRGVKLRLMQDPDDEAKPPVEASETLARCKKYVLRRKYSEHYRSVR